MAITTITTVAASGARNAREEIAGQLSSPRSSYEFYDGQEGLCIQHQDPYLLRLKTIEELKSGMKFLIDAEARREKVSIDWEIHSRIAQAMNDSYTAIVPQAAYYRLKAAGHGYLPYLLTARAVELTETSVMTEIDSEQIDQYARKLVSLREKDLIGDV